MNIEKCLFMADLPTGAPVLLLLQREESSHTADDVILGTTLSVSTRRVYSCNTNSNDDVCAPPVGRKVHVNRHYSTSSSGGETSLAIFVASRAYENMLDYSRIEQTRPKSGNPPTIYYMRWATSTLTTTPYDCRSIGNNRKQPGANTLFGNPPVLFPPSLSSLPGPSEVFGFGVRCYRNTWRP